jgi:hypothetical protein
MWEAADCHQGAEHRSLQSHGSLQSHSLYYGTTTVLMHVQSISKDEVTACHQAAWKVRNSVSNRKERKDTVQSGAPHT